MGFEIPYSEEKINNASNKIIANQNVNNGYVRPVAWRGSEMMAISAQQTKIHVAIATWEWGSYFGPQELSSFVGCFLTGTAAEVTPVSCIAEHQFKVCDTIIDLNESYQSLVRKKKAA